MTEIRALYKRIHKLESLCLSMEEFTNSGSWVYDGYARTIKFSAGGCRILGIMDAANPMPLTILECMCSEGDRKQLLEFFTASHSAGATKSVEIPIQDSYGNQMTIAMCAVDDADSGKDMKSGLIKSIS